MSERTRHFAKPIDLRPGEGIRALVDDVEYAIDVIQPAATVDQADPDRALITDIECLPSQEIEGRDYPTLELQFVGADHPRAVVAVPDGGDIDEELPHGSGGDPKRGVTDERPPPDANQLALERDLAVRQAKLAKAGLHVIRIALNESRPLEALRVANEEIDRLDEELGALEELQEARDDD